MSQSKRLSLNTAGLFALLFVLGAVLLIYGNQLASGSISAANSLRLTEELLTIAAAASAGILLGASFLARRQRAESSRTQKALEEKTAESKRQTATATTLAGEVEAARAELQSFNDAFEERLQERTAALVQEVIDRERSDRSLRESEEKLLLARDELERGLAAHTAELERSNHELEQFAYVASHDLQEPLRAVSGCVQILQKRYAEQLDARGHELIAHTVDGVARLQELIQGLLTYSRVSRDGSELESVASADALRLALQQLEAAIMETGTVVEHTDLPVVCAHPGQLVQLLQNVIGNAIKYRSAAAPRIELSAEFKDNLWNFAVRDNGIGIEPQYFGRVFSIFQRLHTRDEYPGTGIGLAICRRIVEQAGGTMWIESELGKGSTFYFTLLASDPGDRSPRP